VADDADHHPAVAPGGPVAAGPSAVVMPGHAVQPAAAAAPQGVVDTKTTAASAGTSIAAMRSSRVSPSWSADQQAVAKNR
jgi:hypothetical protein